MGFKVPSKEIYSVYLRYLQTCNSYIFNISPNKVGARWLGIIFSDHLFSFFFFFLGCATFLYLSPPPLSHPFYWSLLKAWTSVGLLVSQILLSLFSVLTDIVVELRRHYYHLMFSFFTTLGLYHFWIVLWSFALCFFTRVFVSWLIGLLDPLTGSYAVNLYVNFLFCPSLFCIYLMYFSI